MVLGLISRLCSHAHRTSTVTAETQNRTNRKQRQHELMIFLLIFNVDGCIYTPLVIENGKLHR